MMAKLKGRSKRRRKVEEDMQQAAKLVEHFILQMDGAAEEDDQANRDKRPAIHKLKMLQSVDIQLRKYSPSGITLSHHNSRKHVQNAFIENSGLASLAKWLKPLPDGSLPNVKIRSTLLELLEL